MPYPVDEGAFGDDEAQEAEAEALTRAPRSRRRVGRSRLAAKPRAAK